MLEEMERKVSRADQIDASAWAFHEQHPKVWALFCTFAFDRIDRGFKHYSAKAIFERIRWEMAEPEYQLGLEFKLNNNFPSAYARWFHTAYPEHDGFFRTRVRPSELAPPATGHELQPRDFD